MVRMIHCFWSVKVASFNSLKIASSKHNKSNPRHTLCEGGLPPIQHRISLFHLSTRQKLQVGRVPRLRKAYKDHTRWPTSTPLSCVLFSSFHCFSFASVTDVYFSNLTNLQYHQLIFSPKLLRKIHRNNVECSMKEIYFPFPLGSDTLRVSGYTINFASSTDSLHLTNI